MNDTQDTLAGPLEGPVLLLGIGGMLWRAWDELLCRHGIEHVSPTLDELNFLRPETIQRLVGPQYRLVINTAAYTDVDACEQEEALAQVINGTAVGLLASQCACTGARLLHYSTDYVFDGLGSQPYPTDAPRKPVNAYGRTKALGEQLVEQSGCDYLLVRTSWLYAPWSKNFVRTIQHLAGQRKQLQVVDDQVGRPTSAPHLAETSWQLLAHDAEGIYHVTDGGQCSWFEFACEIVSQSGIDCQVLPCTSDQFPRPAQRPAYSVLDLSRTTQLLGPLPDWRENLNHVLQTMEPQTV